MKMSRGTYIALAAVGIMLSGCSAISGLRMPANADITGNDIPALIKSAQTVQAAYATQIGTLSKDLEDSAKFNLIDGTALAAASIYHGNRSVLSFFGLAGGANIATDATFNYSIQLNAYESGYNAIGCMVEKAQSMPADQSSTLLSIKNRKELLANAKTPLREIVKQKSDGKEVKSEEPPQPVPADESKVDHAIKVEVQKVERIIDAAASVDIPNVFKMNLTALDQKVRHKLREALKAQQPTALRDQLIANAVEAEKHKDQAKAAESAINALNGLRTSSNVDATSVASIVSSAADIAAFDSDLKKCIAGAGF